MAAILPAAVIGLSPPGSAVTIPVPVIQAIRPTEAVAEEATTAAVMMAVEAAAAAAVMVGEAEAIDALRLGAGRRRRIDLTQQDHLDSI